MTAELRYARLQTLFSGIGIFLSALLSIAGLWIAWQLSEANDRARAAEVEMDRRARLEDSARASAIACLDLAIRVKEATAGEASPDYSAIAREIANQCKEARVNLVADELREEEINRRLIAAFARFFLQPGGVSRAADAGSEEK